MRLFALLRIKTSFSSVSINWFIVIAMPTVHYWLDGTVTSEGRWFDVYPGQTFLARMIVRYVSVYEYVS